MRFFGVVGFGATVETRSSIYEEQITERQYVGDVTRNTRQYQSGQGLNDDLDISNQISIVADPYALAHFQEMRYVVWNNSKWRVKSVEIIYPRLLLTIGGVYLENQTGT